MPRRIKIPFGGQEVEAVEVDFSVKREEWNDYVLADGGRVRVKTSVMKVYRVLDAQGKPAFDPEGDPVVVVRSNNQVIASTE